MSRHSVQRVHGRGKPGLVPRSLQVGSAICYPTGRSDLHKASATPAFMDWLEMQPAVNLRGHWVVTIALFLLMLPVSHVYEPGRKRTAAYHSLKAVKDAGLTTSHG